MDWNKKDIEELESINILELNPSQQKFYTAMVRFACIGVIPSKKQLIYIHFLSKNQTKRLAK